MNLRIPAFFAALAVFVAAAYLEMKPLDPAELRPAKPAGAAAVAKPPALAARSAVHGAPPAVWTASHPAAAARRSLFGELEHARSYRALYDRLHGSAEGATAEGLYVQYRILRTCAAVTDRPWRRPQAKPVAQRREQFLQALAPNDPLRDKRIAAFEGVSVDHCAGFEDVKVTQDELAKMLATSAEMGDPKARAATVEQQVYQDSRRAGQWRSASLSDSQITTLEQAIGTKDPEAMVVAGRLLSNSWPDLTVHIGGADGPPIEPRAFYNAWQILSCEYGNACGADNAQLLSQCAYNARCDAQSLPDYLYYYGSTPHENELLARYETVLRGAIENGDWSQISVSRGTRMPGSDRFMFGRGPG